MNPKHRLVLVGVASVALVLSACTSGGGGKTSGTAEGDTLKVAISKDILSFDPQAFDVPNFPIIKNFYDPLVEYDESGKPIPALAKSWTVSPDNKSISLELRTDVTFSDGSKFTSKAVAETFEKAADPKRGLQANGPMGVVSGWTLEGDDAITLNFKAPVPELVMMDLLQFTNVINPAGMNDLKTAPAGTGAFTLKQYKPGQEIQMIARKDYWRPQQPSLHGVDLKIFTDQNAAVNALASGQVDVLYDLSTKDASRLKEQKFHISEGTGSIIMLFVANPNQAPFDNKLVRQAVYRAINRDLMVKAAWNGVSKSVTLPWVTDSPAYDAAADAAFGYDLEAAKELIGKSGKDIGSKPITLLTYGALPEVVASAQILKSDLEKIGMKVTIDPRDPAAFEDLYGKGDYQMAATGVGNVQKFPTRIATNTMFRTVDNPVLKDAIFPEYLAAIDEVNTTVGPEAAVQSGYAKLRDVITDQAWAIPATIWATGVTAASSGVSGLSLDVDNMPLFAGATIRR